MLPDLRRLVRGRSARHLVASLRKIFSYGSVIVLFLATLGAVSFLTVRVPQWQASTASIRDPKDRVTAENEIFRSVIQLLGGSFFLIGTYFTWRNLRLAQEGQITTTSLHMKHVTTISHLSTL